MIFRDLKLFVRDINKLAYKDVLLVADENTFAAADLGEQLQDLCSARAYIFPGERLRPDETSVGKLLLASEGAEFIIGVGSGVINDLCRYIAFRSGIDYAIAATALSMDGYLSNVSPIIVGNRKTTFTCDTAAYVLLLPNVVQTAPKAMTAAGVGDVYGKATSVLDWRLAHMLFDERYDDEIAEKTREAADSCLNDDIVGLIGGNDERGLAALSDALVVTGRAMNEFGGSRPASGAEHQIGHFWEDDFVRRNIDAPLHGACVGVALLAVVRMLSLLPDVTPNFDGKHGALYKEKWNDITKLIADEIPDYAELRDKMIRVGCPVSHGDIGVSDELFVRSLKEAMIERSRYTVLRMMDDVGVLDTLISRIQ